MKFDRKSIRKNVDELDKDQGVDIYFNEDDMIHSEKEFDEEIISFGTKVTRMILYINGANKTEIRDTFEKLLEEDPTVSKKFRKLSSIFNDEDKTKYDEWDSTFRHRFLTYTGLYIIRNLKIICSRYYKYHSGRKFIKWEEMGNYSRNLFIELLDFIEKMYRGSKLKENTLNMLFELHLLTDKDGKYSHYHMEMYTKHLSALKKLLSLPSHLIHLGTVFDEIVKLAYISAVKDMNVGFVDYIPNLEMSDRVEIEDVISNIGKRIIKVAKKENLVTPIFSYYVKSNPKVYSNLSKEPDGYLSTGILALSFLRYIVKDKAISSYIDKFLIGR